MPARFLHIVFALVCLIPANLRAQCSFNLNATVVKHSDCAANGIIEVGLSGSEVDLSTLQIIVTNGSNINLISTINNQQFTTLPAGVYTITGSTICKGSGLAVSKSTKLTVTTSYVTLEAHVSTSRKSLNCMHTGQISLYMSNGRAPYKIQLTTKPAAYTGSTEFTQSNAGMFTLDDLPPGSYGFKVTDDCSYEIPLTHYLGAVSSDFPGDPYRSNLYLSEPPATDCSKASAIAYEASSDLDFYWNQHRDKYYEVAFTVNGSAKDWVSANKHQRQTFAMPHTIKEMRDYGYSVDVHLRIKGCASEKLNADKLTVYSNSDIGFSYYNMTCDSYNVHFSPFYYSEDGVDFSYQTLICYPYSWELYDTGSNTLVASRDNILNGNTQNLEGLSYFTNYQLILTDKEGFKITRSFSSDRKLYSYSHQTVCPPNSYKSYLYFYWPESVIPAGTHIKQVSGATIATHSDITLSKDATYFYPFSTDYEYQEYVKLAGGTYQFEITNTCGDPTYTITFHMDEYELKDFGYTSQAACDGLHVFPEGLLYRNGSPITTYFRLGKAPSGVSTSTIISSNSVGQYFLFPKSGTYIIEVFASVNNECTIEQIEIEYDNESFALDSRAAYTCKSGDVPRFYLRAKNGLAPYTYELYENGILAQTNSIGNFIYGHTSNSYSVRVIDACGRSFSTDLQVLDLTYDKIVSGSERVCVGDTIYLSCLSLGSTYFQWTGPSFTSTDQSAIIPNATLVDAGTYYLTLQPMGCNDPVTQNMEVDVYMPPKPTYPDLINLCFSGSNTLPEPTLEPDHSAVWFKEDGVTQCPKPTVPTATEHDEVYYIAQKDDKLGCVGYLQKVTIRVNPLPQNLFDANINKACYKGDVIMQLNNLTPSFTYDIYDNKALTGNVTSVTGATSATVDLNVAIEENTFYYVTVTDDKGCISEPLEEEAEIIRLEITPQKLSSYHTNESYSQQLYTNGVQPTFRLTDGQLPTGLSLSTWGLISGAVTNDKLGPQWFFSIEVENDIGCKHEQQFAMDGNFFIPKVFTPNNDGINDSFMKGFRVTIFDRLGVTVFEGNDGWDGTHKGKPAPPDIYYYKLFYDTVNGQTISKTGYIGLEK